MAGLRAVYKKNRGGSLHLLFAGKGLPSAIKTRRLLKSLFTAEKQRIKPYGDLVRRIEILREEISAIEDLCAAKQRLIASSETQKDKIQAQAAQEADKLRQEEKDLLRLLDKQQDRKLPYFAYHDNDKKSKQIHLMQDKGQLPPPTAGQTVSSPGMYREDGHLWLDSHGITIKASSVTMFHRKDGKDYTLNLIDTPGHVDFAYEVSRSLRACEGAVLLVDANQGVEAQTVATFNQALEHDLEIIPVVTKIDLPDSRPIETMEEMEHTFGLDAMDILAVSGKSGKGVPELLDEIIEKVPPPANNPDKPLRGLIFDSFYDDYRGVIAFIRLVDGSVSKGDEVVMASSGGSYEALELGIFTPRMQPKETLNCGDVGYIVTGIKDIRNVKIGDTIMRKQQPAEEPLAGYVEPKPMVYCGLFPQDNDDLDTLRSALERL